MSAYSFNTSCSSSSSSSSSSSNTVAHGYTPAAVDGHMAQSGDRGLPGWIRGIKTAKH
jgi:hypothetical protein